VTDEPEVGVVRVNVHTDGTRDVEEVGPEHPVIGPLAALVEAVLRTQIAGGIIGVPVARVDVAALPQNAFSVAEEVDYYFTLTERISPEACRPDAVVEASLAPADDGDEQLSVFDVVFMQVHTDLVSGLYGPAEDELADDAADVIAESVVAAIACRYVAESRRVLPR
jgi:hypothetical protein